MALLTTFGITNFGLLYYHNLIVRKSIQQVIFPCILHSAVLRDITVNGSVSDILDIWCDCIDYRATSKWSKLPSLFFVPFALGFTNFYFHVYYII